MPSDTHALDTPLGRRLSVALATLPDAANLGVPARRVERVLTAALALAQAPEGVEPADEDVVAAWDAVSTLAAAARDGASRAVEQAIALGAIVVARAAGVRPWQVRLVRPKPGDSLGQAIYRATTATRRPHGPGPRDVAPGALEGPELIAAAIEASGLSAVQFARGVLGVDDRTVRRWLDGERPLMGTPAKICRAIVANPSLAETLRGV